jgi:hypothetical protein
MRYRPYVIFDVPLGDRSDIRRVLYTRSDIPGTFACDD